MTTPPCSRSATRLGLDFRLSGFASAHFDSQDDLNVALGLSPGGQSFDAIADLDDPNVLGTVHISNLPSSLEVTVSPSGESVTYDASSSINQITADIELRDTGDTLGVDINGVPQTIDLLFDADGSKITWNASAPTTSVSANAHLTPASLGGTRTFDAGVTVTEIPSTWDATWANGNVHFRGISGPIGASRPGSPTMVSTTCCPGTTSAPSTARHPETSTRASRSPTSRT